MEGFWREETPPRARGGDVAASLPCMSMCCRYQPLGKVEVVRPRPHRPRPRPRPSSWSPSLLAPSAHVGVLILFSTNEAPGVVLPPAGLWDPEATLSGAIPREEVGPGGNPLPFQGPVVPCMSSHGDGVTHLGSRLRVLLAFLGNQRCWSHFGIIRGTPCSTAATVCHTTAFAEAMCVLQR